VEDLAQRCSVLL